MASKLLLLLATASTVSALDLKVTGMTCEDLPITADLSMLCDGRSRCTFGEQAEITGTLYYSGVENSGVQNNLAYASADMDFVVTSYDLFDMEEVLLCDYVYEEEGNQYQCPGDGAYDFSMTYSLPSSGSETMSWLASGWKGTAVISFYAAPDVEGMLIGQCTLDLQTFVTPNEEDGIFQKPSAAATAGIVLGALALLSLCCCYCYCRSCCSGGSKRQSRVAVRRGNGELTSSFRQMNDAESVDPAGKYAVPTRSPKASENRSVV